MTYVVAPKGFECKLFNSLINLFASETSWLESMELAEPVKQHQWKRIIINHKKKNLNSKKEMKWPGMRAFSEM